MLTWPAHSTVWTAVTVTSGVGGSTASAVYGDVRRRASRDRYETRRMRILSRLLRIGYTAAIVPARIVTDQMSHLEIRLLGSPSVELDGTPIVVDTRKATALLAFLALTGQRHGR